MLRAFEFGFARVVGRWSGFFFGVSVRLSLQAGQPLFQGDKVKIIGGLTTLGAWAQKCLRGTLVTAVGGMLLATPAAYAGVSNGNFETGDFTGWTVTNYQNNGIGTFPPTQKSHLSLDPPGDTPVTAVIGTAPTSPATAPDVTGQVRIPFQGSYSASINARGDNNRASGIAQSAQMTIADVDPSDGKIHLRMAVAPVIQDGGHGAQDQAYFYVQVRNVTKNTQLFYTFNFAGQAGVPWQTVGGYQYTGWQAIDVAPGNGLLDVGDTVEVEVIAAGCSAGGHSGEVYVDSIGPFFAGLLVSATGPTTTKPSEDVTYTYNYSNNSGVMVFDGQVNAASPQVLNASGTPVNAVFKSVSAPAGTTCIAPAVGSAGTVSCNVGSLVDHSNGAFQITWEVPPTASVTSPSNSLNHGNYSVSATGASTVLGPLVQTAVAPAASNPLTDLSVAVSDGASAIAPGSAQTYTVVVSNNGPTGVVGATLSQQATGMTVNSWTCSATGGGVCPAPSGSGPISSGTLDVPVGATVTYVINATAGAGPAPASTRFTVTPPGNVTDSNTNNNTTGDANAVGVLHRLALTKGGAGSGTVVSVPSGLNCGASCDMSVADGSQAILTATAAPGSIFTGWSGACTGTGNPCTVAAMTADTAVTANFAPTVTVTATGTAGPNGTVTPGTSQTVPAGSAVTYALTPAAGFYPFVTGSCSGTLTGNTYVISAAASDCTVAFSFVPLQVTATAGTNGTVTPAGVTPVATPGDTLQYTVTPSAGYQAQVATGGTACGGTLVGNTFTTSPVTRPCTVDFSFALPVQNVQGIPTLSQWGLIILSALMALFFVGTRRSSLR